jgi:hypothetical protein
MKEKVACSQANPNYLFLNVSPFVQVCSPFIFVFIFVD